eukprot:1151046-Pelagomonas_calceolata.AAC.2
MLYYIKSGIEVLFEGSWSAFFVHRIAYRCSHLVIYITSSTSYSGYTQEHQADEEERTGPPQKLHFAALFSLTLMQRQ